MPLRTSRVKDTDHDCRHGGHLPTAFVPLTLYGEAGSALTLDFLLDTGFNGTLLLPQAQIEVLGLVPQSRRLMRLADDSEVQVVFYRVRVEWEGEERSVGVIASGSEPLLGMTLVTGYNISIDVVDGGRVSLIRLPASAAPCSCRFCWICKEVQHLQGRAVFGQGKASGV
jgi:clan AA aspartic protease